MRKAAVGLSGAVLLVSMIASRCAQAEVAMTGTFTATQACPAYQSFRKSTDPGDVKVEKDKTYALIAKNKSDATHYRIVVEGAEPKERWVSSSCGRIEPTDRSASEAPQPSAPTPTPPVLGGTSGARATHVLAMGWEPAFCEDHRARMPRALLVRFCRHAREFARALAAAARNAVLQRGAQS